MPIRQGGSVSNNANTCERRNFLVSATLPATSTPCTWNTFLARSIPIVLVCIWTAPSCDSSHDDHPMALDAGSGRRPPHQNCTPITPKPGAKLHAGSQHGSHLAHLRPRHVAEHVAVEMDQPATP